MSDRRGACGRAAGTSTTHSTSSTAAAASTAWSCGGGHGRGGRQTTLAADPEAAHCDVPALLLTRLAGHPPRSLEAGADGFCRELAGALAQIHDAGGTAGTQLHPYRLYYDRAHAAPARWMPATAIWADVTAAVRERPPPAAMTLIHRDYHPKNTLWSRLRLTGVVDWTQASWGPPGLDVGHMRWNLVADNGQDVANRFLACYQAATGAAVGDQP